MSANSNHRVRVGLLGAGGIAPEHALALKQLPQVEMAAVCDMSEPRARALAGNFGIPVVHQSLAQMLERERLDVVHVLTPPQAHAPLALQCIQAGCDVFVEKPMGVTTEECRSLVDAAAAAGRRLGVNQQLTYNPALGGLMAAIRERKLGRVSHAAMNFTVVEPLRDPHHFVYQSTQNMMLEYGPHPYSVIRRLMGKLVHMSTLLSGEQQLPGGKSYFKTWQCSMVCERGTANLYLSIGRDARDVSLHVVGQDGNAFVDLGQDLLLLNENSPYEATAGMRGAWKNARRMLGGTTRKFWNEYAVKMKLKPLAAFDLMSASIGDFYRTRAAGLPFPEDGEAGLAVVEYCQHSATAAHVAGLEPVGSPV